MENPLWRPLMGKSRKKKKKLQLDAKLFFVEVVSGNSPLHSIIIKSIGRFYSSR